MHGVYKEGFTQMTDAPDTKQSTSTSLTSKYKHTLKAVKGVLAVDTHSQDLKSRMSRPTAQLPSFPSVA